MRFFRFVGEEKFYNGLKELEKYLDIIVGQNGVEIVTQKVQAENVGYFERKNTVTIRYCSEHDFFYVFMAYLTRTEKEMNCHSSVQLGFMVDCSRNAVWSLQSVKDCVVYLALMGYSYLELYTEDTYEIPNEKYFGYMRGKYTSSEIKQIDEYAKLFGIELVPCIQTLAHLNGIFKWNDYKVINDVDDILLLRNERSYEFINNMFKSISETFSSRRINVGMDEAMLLGAGQFLNKNGYVPRSELMFEHLSKVVEIAKTYGFKASAWNDMFFRVDNGNEYRVENPVFSEGTLSKIPKDVELVYWDYISEDQTVYENMLKNSLRLTKNVGFAGGLFSWHSFTCDNDLAMRKIVPAVNACKKYNISDILVTTWGDDGAEASRFSCLPTACAFADYAYNGNLNQTSAVLEKLFNYTYREFADISLVNRYLELEQIQGVNVFYGNTAKYMLYNDPFLGLFDNNVPINAKEYSKKNHNRLKELSKRKSSMSYLFNTMSCLSKLLVEKADLGKNIKEHYDSKNKKALKIDLKRTEKCIALLTNFINKYQKQWLKENKPFGLEVHQIRLGGLKERLIYVKQRIREYLLGKIEVIEELEEKRLPGNFDTQDYKYNLIVEFWKDIVTCGKI